MADDDDIASRDRVEKPRYEPEIIPPGRAGAKRRSHIWMSIDESGTHRFYLARPGPFTIFVALVLAGLVVAAIVLLLLGVVLIWIPAVVLIVGALLLSVTIRSYWRRLQNWAQGR